MALTARRRFYKAAGTDAVAGGFSVTLDGRPIRTPAGAPFVVPTGALAAAVAGEWDGQSEAIRPATMPLMQLSCTAIDRVGGERAHIVDTLARYGETDLTCYRAPDPDSLVVRQAAAWQPLVDWIADVHGVRLEITAGLAAVAQPAESLVRLRAAIDAHGDFPLAALSSATAAAGSVVIGLALVQGRIAAAQAFEAAQVDETHQMETWGGDPELEARRAGLLAELEAVARFRDLLAEGS